MSIKTERETPHLGLRVDIKLLITKRFESDIADFKNKCRPRFWTNIRLPTKITGQNVSLL